MKSILALASILFSLPSHADHVRDLGAGFLGMPYQMGDHLPSQHIGSWTTGDTDNQVITFEFSHPVSGSEPVSFKKSFGPSAKQINSFRFVAPVQTEFHFVGAKSDLQGCDAKAQPTVQFYSQRVVRNRITLSPGETVALSAGDEVSIDFNLSNWKGCSFRSLAYEYYLTGKVKSPQTQARYYRVDNYQTASSSEFSAELEIPKIYFPIFRYEAQSFSAPLLEAELKSEFKNCQIKKNARWVYDGGPFTTVLDISLSCPKASEAEQQVIAAKLENLDLVVTDVEKVLAQFQQSQPRASSDPNWYVDRKLPVYSYKSVKLTNFVQAYR